MTASNILLDVTNDLHGLIAVEFLFLITIESKIMVTFDRLSHFIGDQKIEIPTVVRVTLAYRQLKIAFNMFDLVAHHMELFVRKD